MRNISKELRKHLTLNKLLLAHKLLFATICALGSGNRDNFIVSRLRVQYMPLRNGRISWLLAGNKGIKDVWLSIIGLFWCLKPNEIIITHIGKDEKFKFNLDSFRLDWGGICFRLAGRLLPSWLILLFHLSRRLRLLGRIFLLLNPSSF